MVLASSSNAFLSLKSLGRFFNKITHEFSCSNFATSYGRKSHEILILSKTTLLITNFTFDVFSKLRPNCITARPRLPIIKRLQ